MPSALEILWTGAQGNISIHNLFAGNSFLSYFKMWNHLAEQLRAKTMGNGANSQPKGCSKKVNKGLSAALSGLQEPRKSLAL